MYVYVDLCSIGDLFFFCLDFCFFYEGMYCLLDNVFLFRLNDIMEVISYLDFMYCLLVY